MSLMIRPSSYILSTVLMVLTSFAVRAQCDTTLVTGNMIHISDGMLSGTYMVDGSFHVMPGVTIYVEPFASGGCGKLEVVANTIVIEGTINGDFAGNPGGSGGNAGITVQSVTGDETAIDGCSNEDDTGQLTVQEGLGGSVGQGVGGGNSGADGTEGSGPKQDCDFFDDEAGIVGGAGGAGGGGGGSYGGVGATSGDGGDGSSVYTNNNVLVSSAFGILSGVGGAGGNGGTTYGTPTGTDIDLGSGGAGAGGGGRSFQIGLPGNNGGAGGGSIRLYASGSVTISGSITANGESGQIGGKGSDGGSSGDCCSDVCDDCGESTYSCGAGGGGGAGGGSGGGILIDAGNNITLTGLLTATGGNGGTYAGGGQGTFCSNGVSSCDGSEDISTGDGGDANDGGGGGGGRIKVFYYDCISNVVAPSTSTSAGSGGANIAASGTVVMMSTPCSLLTINELRIPEIHMQVYPDYISQTLNIQLTDKPSGSNKFRIEVLDYHGRLILVEEMSLKQKISRRISLGDISAGVYCIRLQNESGAAVKRFYWN